MSAFKAANPDAIFEDFIRWHSPKDWEDEETLDGVDAKDQSETKWPPRGRLSARMSDNANSWRKIWNEAPALSVSNQKPLLDPNREGEKARLYIPCCLVTNCPRTLRRQKNLIGLFILFPLTRMSYGSQFRVSRRVRVCKRVNFGSSHSKSDYESSRVRVGFQVVSDIAAPSMNGQSDNKEQNKQTNKYI